MPSNTAIVIAGFVVAGVIYAIGFFIGWSLRGSVMDAPASLKAQTPTEFADDMGAEDR